MSSNPSVPKTAPSSPFWHPSTPQTVVVETPGGSRKRLPQTTESEVQEHKSSVLGCTANLTNDIVGAGFVALPYALKEAGFGMGVLLIFVVAALTEKSLRLLIATAKHVHVASYETLAEAAFGIVGFRFVAINMFLLSYGVMVSYLLLVKDLFSSVIGIDPDDHWSKCGVLFVISLSVMVPLSSKRDMADLEITSRIAVLVNSILVGIVIYNAPVTSSIEGIGGWKVLFQPWLGVVPWIQIDTMFVGVGVLSFAFMCQHSAFIIAGSLDNPTQERWGRVTSMAVWYSCGLELIVGIIGYLGYLEDVNGNILDNFKASSWSAQAGRIMLGTTLLFVYPLESFVSRHSIVTLFFQGKRAHDGNDDSSILNRTDRRIGLTVLVYTLAVIPAAVIENVGVALAITGAVGGSCLCYIGPGAVYLGIHGDELLEVVRQCLPYSPLALETKKQPNTNSKYTPLTIPNGPSNETTPLAGNTTQETNPSPIPLLGRIRDSLLYYLIGMPLWCAIARQGQVCVNKHIHSMVIKSPHPIRIGDVEYSYIYAHGGDEPAVSRKKAVTKTANEKKPEDKVLRSLGMTNTEQDGMIESLDLQIGKRILQRQKSQEQTLPNHPATIERDPQHDPPKWTDFVVAVVYLIFGVLALVAGIVSILP